MKTQKFNVKSAPAVPVTAERLTAKYPKGANPTEAVSIFKKASEAQKQPKL